jgi:hypothetical protein
MNVKNPAQAELGRGTLESKLGAEILAWASPQVIMAYVVLENPANVRSVPAFPSMGRWGLEVHRYLRLSQGQMIEHSDEE